VDGKPSFVAGVPPDYFSATGQRWGNPIYNWENMEKKNFIFWVNRLKYSSGLYDIIRIDHFRAFDTYWKIPASCDTAVEGEWVEAPGYALFNEIYRQIPEIAIVAEDLGDLRPEVLELRDDYKLPGMNVAEFSLLDMAQGKENQVIYTGTHDNQTVRGWYESLDGKTKAKVRKKLAKYGSPWESFPQRMLRFVYASRANMAIVPLADLLDLDDRARLNTPGTVGSPNWEWRLTDWSKLIRRKALIRELVVSTGRHNI
jgi:4-alpha-glucanotransferase